MSRRAWTYVWSVFLAALILSAVALANSEFSLEQWPAFAVLTGLATLAQLVKANTPNRKLYYTTLVFVFAGLLLLPPFLFVLLVAISHSVEWAKERWRSSSDLRDWYLQPFNISMHVISGFFALFFVRVLAPGSTVTASLGSLVAVSIGAFAYVASNQLILGLALVWARNMSWRDASRVDLENIQADLIHLVLGYVIAILWIVNPWLILPALAPLVLTVRSLRVPQLQQEAFTDPKTGLFNARHFNSLFTREVERARRFGRPVAIIMSDLDLLRNINNTYGHLAGDRVLADISQILRETVREYDIAARFGGEEFSIALPESDLEGAYSMAERIRVAIEEHEFHLGTHPHPIHATMSFGVAAFPEDGETPAELVHAADLAVYQAKLNGRNCVQRAAPLPRLVRQSRLNMPGHLAASMRRPFAADPIQDTRTELERRAAPRQPELGQAPDSVTMSPRWHVVLLFTAGLIVSAIGIGQIAQLDLVALSLFVIVGVISARLEFEGLEESIPATTTIVVLGVGLLTGTLGIAILAAVLAIVEIGVRGVPLSKAAWTWGTYTLCGAVFVGIVGVAEIPLEIANLSWLLALVMLAGLGYYLVRTGLVAVVSYLEDQVPLAAAWRIQFLDLLIHCAVESVSALVVALAYLGWGPLGLLLFSLPLVVMRFAQRRYVQRTESSMRDLGRVSRELGRANQEMLVENRATRLLTDDLLSTLARVSDGQGTPLRHHASTVATFACAIAEGLGLPEARVGHLRRAALLHDIGRTKVAQSLLFKPGRLLPAEYEAVQEHVNLGANMHFNSETLLPLVPIFLHHHEWWNGEGYPGGLAREQIPLESRILAVCDGLEAMSSPNPYRPEMRLDAVILELSRCSGTQFDPAVVDVLFEIIRRENSASGDAAAAVSSPSGAPGGRSDSRVPPVAGRTDLTSSTPPPPLD